MAKNSYGFISKRYAQPIRYERYFSSWCAIYMGKDGKIYMIEAVPHFLASTKEGAGIERFEVLRKDDDARRIMGTSKTQKGAMEILSKYCDLK